MKVVLLAGGLGTRINEESHLKPKPMVEIGGKPILWHIMKMYSAYGMHDFIICGGYKAYVIKEYFANYYLQTADVKIDVKNNKLSFYNAKSDPWTITVVDTGLDTMTGGRLNRVREYLDEESFCMTYGDGVSDINIANLIGFHKSHGRKCTVTAVQPPARFGSIIFNGDEVAEFEEKPKGDGQWVNGGFFVLEPSALNFIMDDSTVWEHEPLRLLAQSRDLMAYRHHGFWAAMDTLRDRSLLEAMWQEGKPPWKLW